MKRVQAIGLNGFSITVDQNDFDKWIRRAKRLGCTRIEIRNMDGSNLTTIMIQQ